MLEGSFGDVLPFVEIDRTPRVPFQAGIEELLQVFDGGFAALVGSTVARGAEPKALQPR